MTIAHLIYIPLVVLAGVMLGWSLGGSAARQERERLARRLEEAEQELARARLQRVEGGSASG